MRGKKGVCRGDRIYTMLRLNRELSDELARKMYIDPGDEDFGHCFFNARRALFRLTRLGLGEADRYSEGFAVYFNYRTDLHWVAAHGWVTQGEQVIDPDYASLGRYEVDYFPGLNLSADEVYQRLKISSPPGDKAAFGLMPMGAEMAGAYVAAWEHVLARWPEEISPTDQEHVNQWRQILHGLQDGEQREGIKGRL